MPYIRIDNAYPGIMGAAWFKPGTGKAMFDLAQRIMRGPSSLTRAERELIATFVSARNDCEFCTDAHAAVCESHLGRPIAREDVLAPDFRERQPPKLRALLEIADRVRIDGRQVRAADVAAARAAGAGDEDIHDTVLVAAAFCMYNRYVDGLGLEPMRQRSEYLPLGALMARFGYLFPPRLLRWPARYMLDRMFPRRPPGS